MQEHPDKFLHLLPPQGRELAGRVGQEALILGASTVRVEQTAEWWVISADLDWLVSAGLEVRDFFEQLVPFPESGVTYLLKTG